MAERRARNLIRILTAVTLLTALAAYVVVPASEDLPTIALQQAGLYRPEVALLVFYGGLLIVTPAFSGLVRGQLPIEISVRGAKFTEKAEQAAQLAEARIDGLARAIDVLSEELLHAPSEIEQMREGPPETTRNRK